MRKTHSRRQECKHEHMLMQKFKGAKILNINYLTSYFQPMHLGAINIYIKNGIILACHCVSN